MENHTDWIIDNLPSHPEKLKNSMGVWLEAQDLFVKYDCVSLGWGSPDFQPPRFLVDELEKAMEDPENNQYGRGNGTLNLVNAIAKVYGGLMGRNLDPVQEIMVTQGANGVLNTFMMASIDKGEEVVVFTPMFPIYGN